MSDGSSLRGHIDRAQREMANTGFSQRISWFLLGQERPVHGWVLLLCYKSCWDGAFQATEELGTALQLRLEGREEEEVDSDSAWEPGQTGQRRGEGSEAVLGRLEALEADVRFLCTELGAEKLLWSSRFLELLREQQSLRQRLQELPWQWNSGDSPDLLGEAEDQSASGSEGESPEGRGWKLLGMGQCADLCHWAWPPAHTWALGGDGQPGRCWEKLPVFCIYSHQEPGWMLPVVSPVPPFLFSRMPVDGGTSAATWLHPA
ncbi:uncharacterized protein LOC117007691 [Catharus ustulatus]|uniref:uncharacterized protein LOC117007691 n=1 Tax=Catharus ustulatus TaxID=91951 RepID=UPI00140B3CF5|nr:uncharacterized protein LOC117007691 [Catharus ustulatus]